MNEIIAAVGRLVGQVVFWVIVQPWEQCFMVRAGRRVIRLKPGVHLRIPILDAVFKQSSRLRTSMLPTQTLSTADGATVVAGATLAYSVADVEKLYQTLHHAEDTVVQLAACALAKEVFVKSRAEITPDKISAAVSEAIRGPFAEYGLSEAEVRVTDFAFIRAFRLVQDGRWSQSGSHPLNTGEGPT